MKISEIPELLFEEYVERFGLGVIQTHAIRMCALNPRMPEVGVDATIQYLYGKFILWWGVPRDPTSFYNAPFRIMVDFPVVGERVTGRGFRMEEVIKTEYTYGGIELGHKGLPLVSQIVSRARELVSLADPPRWFWEADYYPNRDYSKSPFPWLHQ